MSSKQRIHTPSGIYRLLTEQQQAQKEERRKKTNDHVAGLQWTVLMGAFFSYGMGLGLALIEAQKYSVDLRACFWSVTVAGWSLFLYGHLFARHFQKFQNFSKMQWGILASCVFLAFGWVAALCATRSLETLAVLSLILLLWIWLTYKAESGNWHLFLKDKLLEDGILNLKKGTIAVHRIRPESYLGDPKCAWNGMRFRDLLFYLGTFVAAAAFNYKTGVSDWGDFLVLMSLYCLCLARLGGITRNGVQAFWISAWERENTRVMYLDGHESDMETLKDYPQA